MRVNVSIDDKLLNDLDAYCEKHRYTRSEFLSKLMRDVVYGLHTGVETVKNPDYYVQTGTMPVENTGALMDFCRLNRVHPFIKGVKYKVQVMTEEDNEGRTVIDHLTVCDECLKAEESKVSRVGGVIYLGADGNETRLTI